MHWVQEHQEVVSPTSAFARHSAGQKLLAGLAIFSQSHISTNACIDLVRCVQEQQELVSPTSAFARHSAGQEAPWPAAAHNMTSSFSANLGMMTQRSSYMHVSVWSHLPHESWKIAITLQVPVPLAVGVSSPWT